MVYTEIKSILEALMAPWLHAADRRVVFIVRTMGLAGLLTLGMAF